MRRWAASLIRAHSSWCAADGRPCQGTRSCSMTARLSWSMRTRPNGPVERGRPIAMTTRPPTVKLGAAIVVGAGALAALMQLHPDKLRAPAWIALSAAGVLGAAGVCVIAQALRFHRLAHWLVCGLLGAMA